MSIKAQLTALVVLVGLSHTPAWALRCGTKLVETGDKTFEVRRKCGDPVSEESVGYTLSPSGDRELFIKEWVYGPHNGVYDYLTFHGTTLVKIETRRER